MDTVRQALKSQNSRQETECDADHCLPHFKRFTMAAVIREMERPRGRHRCCNCGLAAVVALVSLMLTPWFSAVAQAEEYPASPVHTTVVIFADNPMWDVQWNDLFAALRSGLREEGAEMQPILGTAEIMRGDLVQPGIRVQSAIVVYLHGNCSLEPLIGRAAFGVPLGWVRRIHGRIEPFVHVDCTRIGQVLGPQVRGVKRVQRMQVMAGALARVILHEWIHIATQSPAHAESGVEKAQFGVADLMAGGR
jgi:hypothetical protein